MVEQFHIETQRSTLPSLVESVTSLLLRVSRVQYFLDFGRNLNSPNVAKKLIANEFHSQSHHAGNEMPQTSLLTFFAPPPKDDLKSDDEINDNRNETAQQQTLQNETQSTNLQNSRVLEILPAPLPFNTSTNVIIPSHMPKAAILTIQPFHLPGLKNITAVLLPVRYSDKFYNECIEDKTVASLSRVVLYDSRPVGWIRCRLDPVIRARRNPEIYIQALGLLAPYRGYGLASFLINEVLSSPMLEQDDVSSIYAHVWEANVEALEWYEKRGFQKTLLVQQYYRKLKPTGAWIVRKDIRRLSIQAKTM